MRGYLDQRDLYARLSIKALMPQQQADLLSWAEAHTVLAFIARVEAMKRCRDRFTAMLEARDAPTVYNVWMRVT